MEKPSVLPGGWSAPEDPRVVAVLAVLAGETSPEVAERLGFEQALLDRWVGGFIEAGAAHLTNRPDDLVAAQRDRFLTAFSHELRTPLARARGWASMLAEGEVPAERAVTAVTRLVNALEVLSHRVDDAQYLATAALGRLSVTPQVSRVGSLVDGLPLGCIEAMDAAVEVVGDRGMLARVLRDLWDAAGLVEPARRTIEVEPGDSMVEVKVVRRGPPIPPWLLTALFEPFDHNDDSTGVTVGLYLARALVVANGGTIGVEQDDTTTVFWVRLVAPDASAPTPEDPPCLSSSPVAT
ncbi:histidine kinase dimerization/phospho-acceptor domain-containing protein [Nocardioides acrostichi]|uniref:histidine kinase n=1 Tax=Nocardioides acrostichi TaxID=2784339 RepID=A0A930Y7P8_9ACTN|nr:HAMP domain-containing sensor histidine kinase [Nocardioides acrostichi]MBF4163655.1 HAMP domain-containing histidine kinase [Nocardioides acrostichi]